MGDRTCTGDLLPVGLMIERRRAELRAAPGRRIVGPAMRYGSEAVVRMPDGAAVRERFAAFAFAEYRASGGATALNLMHDRTLTLASTAAGNLALTDGPRELRMVATLPTGDAYDEALRLVADGSTAETSVEFRALEQRIEGDRRTVLQAALPAIGIVDAGAYGNAGGVEVRREGRGLVRARAVRSSARHAGPRAGAQAVYLGRGVPLHA